MQRNAVPVYLIAAVLVPTMVACGQNTAPTNVGTSAGQVLAPMRQTTMTPITPIHLPVQPQDGVAREIDRIFGAKWTVVLQEGTRVYVGTFPENTGRAGPGAAPSATWHAPGPYAAPEQLKHQSPEAWIRALNDWAPRVDTYNGWRNGRGGRMDANTQKRVRDTVKRALPVVRHVFITSDVASSNLLHAYSDYIHAGGDMNRYMDRFHQRINQIWPHGQGVEPDRPSASPDFGVFGPPPASGPPGHPPVQP